MNDYRKLTDASEWSPAKHAQDSKAPPAQFAANAAEATTLTDIQIMALGCNLALPLVSRLERAITVRSPELKNKQGRNNARGANRGPSSGTNQMGQLVWVCKLTCRLEPLLLEMSSGLAVTSFTLGGDATKPCNNNLNSR